MNPILFKNCEFWQCDEVLTKRENISYENCKFKSEWILKAFTQSIEGDSLIYKNCEFKENVSLIPENAYVYTERAYFNNCNFKKKLEIERVIFSKCFIENNNDIRTEIGQFSIARCNFEEKFFLNNCNIKNFVIKDSKFVSKFEFKNNTVMQDFEINNTNYSKLADMYETNFLSKFKIKKSIFNDFVAFEKCKFGENDKENAALFQYVTFYSFANFRNTKFFSGLDIETINPKESPNFLGTSVNPINSNRETFRIIKNSFIKTENNIEANKYFAEEMNKYRKEIRETGIWHEKIILFYNGFFSNFGQSYIRPLIALLVFTAIYYSLQIGQKENWLYEIYPAANVFISCFSYHLNGFARSLIPFNRFLYEGMEFLSLFFYIFNSSFIWLIIVAIKRRTKR
ncbi:MAG: hypothetical protein IPH22_02040 [Nitrosomonas sp.]|nr:hypothetical protein [Nitrosomonas sp.]